MRVKGTMQFVWVKNLQAFRQHPALQPVEVDGVMVRSELDREIRGKRSKVIYLPDDTESIAAVADLSGGLAEAIEANPNVVEVIDPVEIFGDPNNQARDPETGEKLWTTEAGTEIVRTRVQTGTVTVTPTRLEKRVTDGYELREVEVPVYEVQGSMQEQLDEEGNTVEVWVEDKVQVGTRNVERWVYTLTPETDAEGNEVYPPVYYYAEVEMPDEAYEKPVYEWQESTVPVTRKVPLLDPIEPNPAKRAIYDRLYDRTPKQVTLEDGSTVEVTPPLLFGFIDGHVRGA